ncbi:MAG TPA: 4'-phosphopantetheinyl transferase superfamily protein [Syntrophales bacterium]|nr:4'-phosphopantetheinyl transferase superfamily protein [Syntrophales bacterium]
MIESSVYKTYVDELFLQRPDEHFRAGICFCSFPDPSQYHEIVKMLHPQEMDYYDTLTFEKRKHSYLIGRYAAKQAISALTGGKNDLQTILIQQGIFNQPIATSVREQNLQVSIAHCDELGAALAFPEAHPMGIDVENVCAERCSAMESQMTMAEKNMIKGLSCSYERLLTLLWTVKEALSKVLRTGLTTPFSIFEINKIESRSDHFLCFFENFGQYKALSFDVGMSVCSFVFPIKTEMTIDIPLIGRMFDVSPEEKQK